MSEASSTSQQTGAALVLEAMSEGVLGLDRERRITSANRAAQRMLGWTKDDLVGQKLHALLQSQRKDGSPSPESESPLAWLDKGGALYYIEDVFWCKNGCPLDVEISAAVLPEPESGTYAMVVINDISEHKENQSTLLKAFENLEAVNRSLEKAHSQLLQSEKLAAVGQLAAGMAHEINNPIGFVSSNLGSLDKYVSALLRLIDHYEILENDGGILPERMEALNILKKSIEFQYIREDVPELLHESRLGVERIRKIVKSLKDFSHEDSEYQWAETELHRCLDATLDVVRSEFENKCEIHCDYGEIPLVYCLASEINQVFMSVLLNAAQAIEDHGDVHIRTRVDGTRVVIEISDTGCGIPPEIQRRIFDPFFTTKPIGQGSGLGLSEAYGTVQRHGGSIEIDSAPGKGTTVRIFLPVRPYEPVHVE
jgi:two-component system, NtrC family, sensor kinase